jgi:hypothetical protein
VGTVFVSLIGMGVKILSVARGTALPRSAATLFVWINSAKILSLAFLIVAPTAAMGSVTHRLKLL